MLMLQRTCVQEQMKLLVKTDLMTLSDNFVDVLSLHNSSSPQPTDASCNISPTQLLAGILEFALVELDKLGIVV